MAFVTLAEDGDRKFTFARKPGADTLLSPDEIREEDYNLSVSTYVEQEDTREKIDIVKLNAEIKEIIAREQVLRDEIDKIIAKKRGKYDDEKLIQYLCRQGFPYELVKDRIHYSETD